MESPVVTNGFMPSRTELRIDELEKQVKKLQGDLALTAWCHAELAFSIRKAVATQMAQRMQPAIQNEIMKRLMSGSA